MAYVILRWAYGIYFLVAAVVILTALSDLLFGSRRFPVRVVEFGRRLVLVPFWPLLFFSSGGIRQIFSYVDKL